MKKFQSKVRQQHEEFTVTLEATDEEDAKRKLHTEGFGIISLKEVKTKKSKPKTAVKKKAKAEIQRERKARKPAIFLLISAIVLIAFIAARPFIFKSGSSISRIDIVQLKVGVKFSGDNFEITNNDRFNWTDVRMEINDSSSQNPYIYELNKIERGKTYIVNIAHFKDIHGRNANPDMKKVDNFTISCNTSKGKGYWYGNR